MLTALSAKPLVSYNNVQVVAPKLYHYDSTKGNLFMEDMVDTVDLKRYITENKTSLVQAAVERLGTALGKWLASFHVWGAAEEQNSLRVAVATNPITQLKYAINYGRLEATIELAPGILASSRQLFKDMAIAYKEEFDLGKGTLIHGDFWTGK
jgi:5-methylthioribose kinase